MDSSMQLVAQLRALIETVRTTDLEQAQASGVDLAQIADQLRAQVDQLAPHVVDAIPTQIGLRHEIARVGPERIRGFGEGEVLDIFPYSPITGRLNPVAPPINMWREGSTVCGKGRIPTWMNGRPGAAHGGFVAAILDELLGMAGVVGEVGGFTGTLTVRYVRPTPLATDLDLAARVESTDGRKVKVTGEITVDGEVCASADAVFIRPA